MDRSWINQHLTSSSFSWVYLLFFFSFANISVQYNRLCGHGKGSTPELHPTHCLLSVSGGAYSVAARCCYAFLRPIGGLGCCGKGSVILRHKSGVTGKSSSHSLPFPGFPWYPVIDQLSRDERKQDVSLVPICQYR